MNDKNQQLKISSEIRTLAIFYGPFILISGFEAYQFFMSGSTLWFIIVGALFCLLICAAVSNLVFLLRHPDDMRRYQNYCREHMMKQNGANGESATVERNPK